MGIDSGIVDSDKPKVRFGVQPPDPPSAFAKSTGKAVVGATTGRITPRRPRPETSRTRFDKLAAVPCGMPREPSRLDNKECFVAPHKTVPTPSRLRRSDTLA